jgi:hypothetical protein
MLLQVLPAILQLTQLGGNTKICQLHQALQVQMQGNGMAVSKHLLVCRQCLLGHAP